MAEPLPQARHRARVGEDIFSFTRSPSGLPFPGGVSTPFTESRPQAQSVDTPTGASRDGVAETGHGPQSVLAMIIIITVIIHVQANNLYMLIRVNTKPVFH